MEGSFVPIWFFIFFILAACAPKMVSETVTYPSLKGSLESGPWRTSCLTNGTSDIQITLSFTGGTYSNAATFYQTGGCSVADFRGLETGTYVASGMSSAGSGTINWTLSEVTLTPVTSAIVTSWNSDNYCGYSDWSLNTAKSVLGRTCGSVSYSTAGTVDYDIYNIDQYGLTGASPGDLSFGLRDLSHDGTTEAKRPTVLNGNLYLHH